MTIQFIKAHLGYKIGDVIENHINAVYLIKVGVAVEYVSEEIEVPKKRKHGKL